MRIICCCDVPLASPSVLLFSSRFQRVSFSIGEEKSNRRRHGYSRWSHPCSLLLFRAASAARLLLAALDPAAAAAGAIPVTGASCKAGDPKPASALAAGIVKEVRPPRSSSADSFPSIDIAGGCPVLAGFPRLSWLEEGEKRKIPGGV